MNHAIVSRDEWLEARKALLAKGVLTLAAVGSLSFVAYGASRPTFAWKAVSIAGAARGANLITGRQICRPLAWRMRSRWKWSS